MRSAGIVAIVAALLLAGPAGAAPFKIYTQWKGAAMPLDIFNGGKFNNFAHLAPAANVSGQAWSLRAESGDSFRLTTEFRGTDMCLDVVNGGKLDGYVGLRPCGNFSGQYWTVRHDGEWLRLGTQFRDTLCLDVTNGGPLDGMAHLVACGDFSGQHWKME